MSAGAGASPYPIYPVGLRLGGRRVVVVGGGPVGERRVRGLLVAGADVVVLSSSLTAALRELVDDGRLTWWERRYTAGDLSTAWYAIAATPTPEVNAAIMAEADRRKIFCVRADDASGSSAWTLAAGQHGDLTVAVSGGGDPRRAAAARDAIVAGLADGTLPDRPYRACEK
ncbi:MAG: precorrin-2 dehydrogenase/sirohydrochlorin ferrochelatase family protein [Geodermatophilaceae bacterium]|jgi:uroporphyrin-III C-methyltransferase/precorrin-2 dehydrogenase/sirohydrochlorin ferrochelatase